MAVKKLSVALDEHAEKVAREAAEHAGMSFSAWLSRAAEKSARIEDGLRAVEEVEAEYGEFPEESRQRAKEILDRYGVGRED